MKQVTLCYLFRDAPKKQLLLAMKKRGFGAGKLNGVGGKCLEGESPEQAAVRELEEEICVKTLQSDLEKIGEIDYFYPHAPKSDWNQTAHIFALKKWVGEPKESEEMQPLWVDTDNIPFDRMWKDDPFWFNLLLSGRKFKARFVFAEDNGTVKEHEVHEL